MSAIAETGKEFNPTFREKLEVLDKKGHREWLYPKSANGNYFKARLIIGLVLLALLFSGPFLKVNGQPVLLLNVLERRFIIFGVAFFPQDFYLFALGMLAFIVFIALFTVVFGRVFCGWACPQTIFMEIGFRQIEQWIEGDANQRRKLDAAPWTTQKIAKKTIKHILFFAVSFLIANTFLGYLIGIEELEKLIIDTPAKHLGTFTALIIFTGVFYIVFAFIREIVCIVICPYGRLQGVMLDNNSIVVAYDFIRGEPRGKMRKNEIQSHGDCIDCKLCVHVCPTGIDIRNGTQMECINCTACIDACDDVMIKINRPTGLIRYDSIKGIQDKLPFKVTPRIIGYSLVLVFLLSLVTILFSIRKDVDVTILRTPGMLYQQIDKQTIGNLYNVEFVNKTFQDMSLELKVKNNQGKIRWIGNHQSQLLHKQEIAKAAFFIEIPKNTIQTSSTKLTIEVYSNGKLLSEQKTSFLGPVE
ncbi:cytochrome c oxidase accessory protein CcoG [Cytophagaceae bacterium YF14B1]|uniref:Cytochrome c oxidase accessory protein CcoG n=1 Tax=Xanthocytophaga flava TaxID=3048013 RepID=A0AAE3U423_9BACT|nr:cytochrome c oxidase accessory protein CcoG [Xanthocytophaga flavus]MDJ1479339.1 cytochrome c oxidase accessory protein CcoG [Xanthocytophaga flavus]